jgi:hypothetical protein
VRAHHCSVCVRDRRDCGPKVSGKCGSRSGRTDAQGMVTPQKRDVNMRRKASWAQLASPELERPRTVDVAGDQHGRRDGADELPDGDGPELDGEDLCVRAKLLISLEPLLATHHEEEVAGAGRLVVEAGGVVCGANEARPETRRMTET